MNKRNYWPVALCASLALFFAGVVSFTVYASRQRVDLVSPDYYHDEITYQQQIEREHRGTEADTVQIEHLPKRRELRLHFAPTQVAAGIRGRLTLYRPSDAAADTTHVLDVDANGLMSVPTSELAPGLWRARVRWSAGTQDYFREEVLVL